MAQWRTDLNEFKQPHNVHLYELGMIATVDGNPVTSINRFPVSTSLPGSISAFGEPYAIPIIPQIQLDSIYGITNDVFQTLNSALQRERARNAIEARALIIAKDQILALEHRQKKILKIQCPSIFAVQSQYELSFENFWRWSTGWTWRRPERYNFFLCFLFLVLEHRLDVGEILQKSEKCTR